MESEQTALHVVKEMIMDRGYVIDDSPLSVNDEEDTYCIRAHNKTTEDVILCFMSSDEKLNIQGIKDKISILNKEGATRCIIIYKSSVTSSAKKSLETVNYEFELFALHELQFNVTKHRLVPRHERVTPDEKAELDKNYKGKLPILLHTDAISRYYGFHKGEYIRITRKNGSICYRLVK